MAATIVIGALIFLYAAYIIRKKIRNWKHGGSCNCGCPGCGGGCRGFYTGNMQNTGDKTTR